MSASKLDTSGIFGSLPLQAPRAQFALCPHSVQIHKNGIEFRTNAPIPKWTEMTVDMELPHSGKQVHGRGIVVACSGTRQSGYKVSMVLLNLSRHSQLQLDSLA